jgi:hypothetical protein
MMPQILTLATLQAKILAWVAGEKLKKLGSLGNKNFPTEWIDTDATKETVSGIGSCTFLDTCIYSRTASEADLT